MFRRIIDVFSRVFVGGLFIFSGLIKLNDPIGTKIKLHEYFEVFSADFGSFFELFIPLALPLGMILIILEIVLGVAVLINYNMKSTMTIMLVLLIFFTFLTFYSAYFNKVTDCGCFGDAIPLDPWQSFFKDVILMVFVLHLFWYRKTYKPLLSTNKGRSATFIVAVISTAAGIGAIRYLPYIDFRPYKVGNSIPKNMIAEERPILEYTFEKDGKKIESTTFMLPKDGYKYLSSKITNEKESTPKITDYQVTDAEGNDYTEETFKGRKLLLIFYDTSFEDKNKMQQIGTLIGEQSGAKPMILTSAGGAAFEAFRHKYQLAAPYYFTDATVLKAMIRSNPGIMLLEDGVVLGKWHHNDIPAPETIDALTR